MSFLSIEWLIWMWATIGIYWLIARDWRPWFLMAVSLSFLASVDLVSLALLIAAWGMTTVGAMTKRMTLLMLLGVGGVLAAVLAGFKLQAITTPDSFVEDFGIPLGLSYYTFRCLHVLLERFKGNLANITPLDLACYLFFSPTFVVGPIHRIDTFMRDQKRQRFEITTMVVGAERILFGYVKIVVLSNFLLEGVMEALITHVAATAPWWALYLEVVKDGLNIYLQFSGHCDIAIGFAAMLGFQIIENFNWPYLKRNISEFWQSWHISLSRWCREYIYGPVVAKTRSPALGALATMILIGLWHEISLRYLIWAGYHWLGILAWQKLQLVTPARTSFQPTMQSRAMHVACVLLTLHFVWFSFVILTTPRLADVPARFLALAGLGAG